MRKLWLIFIGIFIFSFSVLGWVGTEIFRQAPPIPREVVTANGQVLIPAEEISNGQNVWQAMGGMQVGSFGDTYQLSVINYSEKLSLDCKQLIYARA